MTKIVDNNKRLTWLDTIKVIGTFLIVLQHSISIEWIRTVSTRDELAFLFNFVFMVSRVGVPLFFMASGYGMLGKNRSIHDIFCKNILTILKVYACWMLVYGAIEATKAARWEVGAKELIKNVLFGRYHTWFIATLLGLYLITPFIDGFISDKALVRYFVVLSIVFTLIIPFATGMIHDERAIKVVNDMDMNFVVGYVIYYVVGYYVGHLEITKKRAVISGLEFCIAVILTGIYSYYKSFSIGTDCQDFYAPLSIMGFIISVSLFYLVRAIMNNGQVSEKWKKAIAYISGVGVAIYLMHPLFLPLVAHITGIGRFIVALQIYLASLLIALVISVTPIRKLLLK